MHVPLPALCQSTVFESMPSPLVSHCGNLQHLTGIHYSVVFEAIHHGDFTPHPKSPVIYLNFFSAQNTY